MFRLTKNRKKALAEALPMLQQLGVNIPSNVASKLDAASSLKLSKQDIAKIEKKLNMFGKVVVTRKCRGGIGVMTFGKFVSSKNNLSKSNRWGDKKPSLRLKILKRKESHNDEQKFPAAQVIA